MAKKTIQLLFVAAFLSIFLLSILRRKTSVENTTEPPFIHDFINKTVNTNLTAAKKDTCKDFLLTHRNVYLDESLLKRMTEICLEKTDLRTDTIFNKDVLDPVLRNISCIDKKRKFLNELVPLAALASFPGSGNTWTRALLESITGIHTGSLYPDPLAKLPGSRKCPATAGVLIVKTHKSSDTMKRGNCPKGDFSKAIFLLRNPYDALIAEFNRKKGGKVGFADRTAFSSNGWKEFVNGKLKGWSKMALFWMKEFDRPVYVLVYENLKGNIMLEMYRIMNFLNFKVTLQDLYCLANRSVDRYYRAKKPDWLTKTALFSKEMKERVNSEIKAVNLHFARTSSYAKVFESYIIPDSS